MENNSNQNDKKSAENKTEKEIRRELALELHEYALVLQEKAQSVASLAATLEGDEQISVEEFIEKCREKDILLGLIEDFEEKRS